MSTTKRLTILTMPMPGDSEHIRLLIGFGNHHVGMITLPLDDLSEFVEGVKGGFDDCSIKAQNGG